MANFTPAQVSMLIDNMVSLYMTMYGSSTSDLGVGDDSWGFTKVGEDLKSLINGETSAIFRDLDIQLALGSSVKTIARYSQSSIFGMLASSLFQAVSGYCANSRTVDSTIVDLDSFMTYYNTVHATKYQVMAPPEWREVYYALTNRYPSAHNLYYSAINGGELLGSSIGALWASTLPGAGAQVDVVDTTKYYGGAAQLRWTGAGGAGAVSVTVVGEDQAGAAETWTASGTWGVAPFNAASGVVDLTPVDPDSLITAVTSLTISGITSGTAYVECIPPDSGRTWPLTW